MGSMEMASRFSRQRDLRTNDVGACLPVRPTDVFPAAQHHRSLACTTKVYCLVTEAHVCEQLAQSCSPKVRRPGVECATCWLQVQRPNHHVTEPL